MKQRKLIILALISLVVCAFSACSSSNRMGCPADRPYHYNRGY